MKKKMTIQEFKGKMDWEGGLYDLALYGLDPEEIKDNKLRAAWRNYLSYFEKLEDAANRVNELLPEDE